MTVSLGSNTSLLVHMGIFVNLLFEKITVHEQLYTCMLIRLSTGCVCFGLVADMVKKKQIR